MYIIEILAVTEAVFFLPIVLPLTIIELSDLTLDNLTDHTKSY